MKRTPLTLYTTGYTRNRRRRARRGGNLTPEVSPEACVSGPVSGAGPSGLSNRITYLKGTVMSDTLDLVHHFSACVAGTRYETLPPEAIDAAKKSILDTPGAILAASGLEPAVHGEIDIVREAGGKPECTLLAFGGRGPAILVAMANGALAHCLDYDDHIPWWQHASSSVVPAVFAVAERQGGVSGKDLDRGRPAVSDLDTTAQKSERAT
jgi:hypothetical protein